MITLTGTTRTLPGTDAFGKTLSSSERRSNAEMDRLREILGMPAEVTPLIVTPLGYPEAFPTGLAPALQRNFRSWRALVHDEFLCVGVSRQK